jgi:hypothetical protein
MQEFQLTEGNLRAVKDLSHFGGVNMWRLEIRTTRGVWRLVQWMSVGNIQDLFKGRLPVYNESSRDRG